MARLFILCITLLFTNSVFASKQTLNVLVVYDTKTIQEVSELDTNTEKIARAKQIVKDLNRSFSNSGLSSHFEFKLIRTVKSTFTDISTSKIPTLLEIGTAYEGALMLSVENNRKPFAHLQVLQKKYKADIVFGIFPEKLGFLNIGQCGIATHIPNNNLPGGISSIEEYIEFAGNGIAFLNANSHCLDKDYLAAHEVGHGMGLFHGPEIDKSEYDSYKNNMIDSASGKAYINERVPFFSRGTIMAAKVGSSFHNYFSDISKSSCGYYESNPCGDNDANAVEVLKKYKESYNKRGDWYK